MKLNYLILRLFLAWTFLNILAHCTVNTFGSKRGNSTFKIKVLKFDFLQLFQLKYIIGEGFEAIFPLQYDFGGSYDSQNMAEIQTISNLCKFIIRNTRPLFKHQGLKIFAPLLARKLQLPPIHMVLMEAPIMNSWRDLAFYVVRQPQIALKS